jgi:hypothetical protein
MALDRTSLPTAVSFPLYHCTQVTLPWDGRHPPDPSATVSLDCPNSGLVHLACLRSQLPQQHTLAPRVKPCPVNACLR